MEVTNSLTDEIKLSTSNSQKRKCKWSVKYEKMLKVSSSQVNRNQMTEISISAYQIGKHFKIISIQYGQGWWEVDTIFIAGGRLNCYWGRKWTGRADSVLQKKETPSRTFSELWTICLVAMGIIYPQPNWPPRLINIRFHTKISRRQKVCAAAKSLQSCPTLCDPIDGSPPGSPIPGILQARTLEWVAISFSNA